MRASLTAASRGTEPDRFLSFWWIRVAHKRRQLGKRCQVIDDWIRHFSTALIDWQCHISVTYSINKISNSHTRNAQRLKNLVHGLMKGTFFSVNSLLISRKSACFELMKDDKIMCGLKEQTSGLRWWKFTHVTHAHTHARCFYTAVECVYGYYECTQSSFICGPH